jgi:hypothetical protein
LSEAGDTKPVYDALGNYVPWQHVPGGAPPNAYPPFSPNFGGLGSSFGSSQDKDCVLNGLPISCSDLSHQIDIGNVAAEEILQGGIKSRAAAVIPFGLGMSYISGLDLPGDSGGYRGSITGEDGNEYSIIDGNTNSTRGYYVFFLRSVAPAPQNTVIEDDPNTITGTTNSKNCGISVNFTPGTTYPNTKLPNGPSLAPDPKTGKPSLGLGFTVTGWVSKGGIGTIGANHTPNPQNPKGVWTIDEETNAWISDGKQSIYVPTFTDIPPGIPNQTSGNGFTWYDHPGNTVWPSNYHRYENHIVKVYNGKEYCEASFHFKQDGGTIHWGAGVLK